MDRLDSLVARAEKSIEAIIRGGSTSNQTDNGLLLMTMKDLFDHLASLASLSLEGVRVPQQISEVDNSALFHHVFSLRV